MNIKSKDEPIEISCKPFLKWAGGKRWLFQHLPKLRELKFQRYIEPFLGGGSIFFGLQPKMAILSDINDDLINCYLVIKEKPKQLEAALNHHQELHSKSYYYQIRKYSPTDSLERASRFIYLNRTCWNGLYRVNLRGEFNVPIGTKNNIYIENEFEHISNMLACATLRTCDFEETINCAKAGDFVFVDPPYTAHHNFNGFLKYNQRLFSWDDQIRLRDAILRAYKRGAKIILTNAAHNSLIDLYANIGTQTEIARWSVISGSPSGRGQRSELVIECL